MFFQQYIPAKIFIFGIDCMEKITGQTIHRKAKRCLVRFADAATAGHEPALPSPSTSTPQTQTTPWASSSRLGLKPSLASTVGGESSSPSPRHNSTSTITSRIQCRFLAFPPFSGMLEVLILSKFFHSSFYLSPFSLDTLLIFGFPCSFPTDSSCQKADKHY
jgi:hypothetical protein